MEPIYFVVAENAPLTGSMIYGYKILACVESTLDQYDTLIKTVFNPVYHGRNGQPGNFRAQVLLIQREPGNPFKDQVFQGSET